MSRATQQYLLFYSRKNEIGKYADSWHDYCMRTAVPPPHDKLCDCSRLHAHNVTFYTGQQGIKALVATRWPRNIYTLCAPENCI